jgi:hypothetical protein
VAVASASNRSLSLEIECAREMVACGTGVWGGLSDFIGDMSWLSEMGGEGVVRWRFLLEGFLPLDGGGLVGGEGRGGNDPGGDVRVILKSP